MKGQQNGEMYQQSQCNMGDTEELEALWDRIERPMVECLTVDEVIEKYSYILTEKEIEILKKHKLIKVVDKFDKILFIKPTDKLLSYNMK